MGATELEMHRADYEACKAAGFQSPGELLSAYKTQSKQLAEAQASCDRAHEIIANLLLTNVSDSKEEGDLSRAEAFAFLYKGTEQQKDNAFRPRSKGVKS